MLGEGVRQKTGWFNHEFQLAIWEHSGLKAQGYIAYNRALFEAESGMLNPNVWNELGKSWVLKAREYFDKNPDKEPEDERPKPMTAKEWKEVSEQINISPYLLTPKLRTAYNLDI